MAVRLSALGLGQLKNSATSSGIEPATFRLVAYWHSVNHTYEVCVEISSTAATGELEDQTRNITRLCRYCFSLNYCLVTWYRFNILYVHIYIFAC
jgi:hypothetical protein